MSTSQALLSTVYTSDATEPFDDDRLGALLAQSRASNGAKDITGMLLYRRGRFIQFLEGPEKRVRDLVSVIAADPRHSKVRVLLDVAVDHRQFSEWTMGFEPVADSDAGLPEGFRRSFDDLERGDDKDLMEHAARELTLWFRVRASGGSGDETS